MTGTEDILLVAESQLARELARQLGPERTLTRHDPYDALMELNRREWSAVVLAAPQADFPGLCRAARRLQGDRSVFAVCPPSVEPEIRRLTEGALDDYVLWPPRPGDLDPVLAACRKVVPAGPDDGPAEEDAAAPEGELAQAAKSDPEESASEAPAEVGEQVASQPQPPSAEAAEDSPASTGQYAHTDAADQSSAPHAPLNGESPPRLPAAPVPAQPMNRPQNQSADGPQMEPVGLAQPARTLDAGRCLAELIRSATSISALESRLQRVLGEALRRELVCVDAEELSPDAHPIVMFGGEQTRALVPADGAASPSLQDSPVVTLVRQCLPSLVETARRTQTLYRLSITDHLTGAYNRRYFYRRTDQILLRARQQNHPVTLLLYDIDNFKRYNDQYGYAAGDDILRETTQLIQRITRAHDVVARIGGDEFAVLFWDADRPRSPNSQPPENAQVLADRFRDEVTHHEFAALGPEARGVLSISGGLASFPGDGATCKELLRQANRALNDAKRSGKNAIMLVGQQ